jgi:hypothetical protein
MRIIFLILAIIFISDTAYADVCTSHDMICPKKDKTHFDTKWSWKKMGCVAKSNLKTVHKRCDNGCKGNRKDWIRRADGCSSPIFKKDVDSLFNEACNVHDMCYSTPGVSKSNCDSEFLNNMLVECSVHPAGGACSGIAAVAAAAVSAAGKSAWDNDQKWANKQCGKSMIMTEKKISREISPDQMRKVKEIIEDPLKIFGKEISESEKKAFFKRLKEIKNSENIK